MPQTLFDKIWDAHEVGGAGANLIYIDLHLVHEVTSPQAFDGLRLAGRKVRRPDRTLATADHNVPTDGTPVAARIRDELSRVQVETLERNCEEFGIPLFSLGSEHQGIVHVIGPELGVTQPGMTIVCGDSHTATHGAFGALAFGIGTSEVEHVLATQCLVQSKPRSMRILLQRLARLRGHRQGPDPGDDRPDRSRRSRRTRRRVRRAGDRGAVDGGPDDGLQHDDRGRRAGGDDRARRHDLRMGDRTRRGARLRSRRSGAIARDRRRRAVRQARSTSTPSAISPMVTWGTKPGMVVPVTGAVPEPAFRPGRARARLHGARARDADRRDQARPRVHRLVHELADRRPARGRRGGQGPQGRRQRLRDGRPRLAAGQGPGRAARASTRSSGAPGSTGAGRAARCASA